MDSIGRYSKAERESKNLSLREVSESTRIKERLLEAIEEDRYELLSSPVYVKGFLDAYARYLGLDPNEVVLQYQKTQGDKILPKGPELKQRMASSNRRQRITFSRKRAFLWMLIIISASLIILFAIIVMYYILG